MHRRHGWEVWPEATYSVFGEPGRIDLLAFHPATGTLEVSEMKTGLWDLQDTLGRLDAKVRLARGMAKDRAWDVRHVVGALVIAEGRTARRRVADHAVLFAGYEVRGGAARAFVRRPRSGVRGLLVFVSLPGSNHDRPRRAGQRSVRPTGR